MRTYTLTDRDFEEFYALMEKVETESKLADGDGPPNKRTNGWILDDLRRQYRYYLIGWRNRMTSGDSYARGPEPPREDSAKLIQWEIERLQKLLPKTE
jgi:hypothetical protein